MVLHGVASSGRGGKSNKRGMDSAILLGRGEKMVEGSRIGRLSKGCLALVVDDVPNHSKRVFFGNR